MGRHARDGQWIEHLLLYEVLQQMAVYQYTSSSETPTPCVPWIQTKRGVRRVGAPALSNRTSLT